MSISPIGSPGCVILLIDESVAMESAVQEEVMEFGQEQKSKGISIANAVNSLLKQLSSGPDFDLTIVGYRSDDSGSVAAVRWGGPLAGREFVSTKDLAANPVAVETRQRRIPDPSSFSGFRAEPVEVPVWYVPSLGGIAPQVVAFEKCKELLERWSKAAGPQPGQPLVIHLFAGSSGDGNPTKAIDGIRTLTLDGRQPLVFQVHLSTAKSVPATLYTSNRSYLPPGASRDLFERSSNLTAEHVAALKAAKIVLSPNARGMLYNAKLIDIVRFLSIIKTHVQNWPPRPTQTPAPAPKPAPEPTPQVAPESAPPPENAAPSIEAPLTMEAADASDSWAVAEPLVDVGADSSPPLVDAVLEKAALVVFLLDRSVQDPFAADPNNPCVRLLDQANDWLGKLAKKPTGQIQVAVVSYGLDSIGEIEIRNTFEAGLTGRSLVTDSELESGAIRIQEIEQQLPNGIGGLLTIKQKQLILVELEPTSAASPAAAFDAVGAMLQDWCGQHPQACVPPVVLHLTRGQHSAEVLAPAAAGIQRHSVASGPVALYHSIATDFPHPSVCYCESESDLESSELQAAFSASSPLLGRDQLTETKPALVKPESRGFVVNGKFDLLLDGIRNALSPG